MKTDELIDMLASGPVAVPARVAPRRYGVALGAAAFGAALLMVGLLGVRPDLHQAVWLPMFWGKLGFVLVLAIFGLPVSARLARPGADLGWLPVLLALPVLALWALALATLVPAEPATRAALLLGQTWRTCPFNIALLSVPGLIAILWAVRGLAPTRLRQAGASSGLLAGAIGASVYSLHCPEMEAPFLAVWYVLGLLIPALAGALIGPRVLRW